MPIGLVGPQPLDAGTAPTPVVTPEANVLNTDAVSNLVNAFRNGAITGQDMADHIGIMATKKNRALSQELSEYVSPKAIEARQSALDAQAAQNRLAQAGAEAQTGLVQPATNLQGLKIGAEAANTVMGPQGMQAIQAYGPWFGETMDDFRKPDGSMDFMGAAKRGNQMAAQMSLANMWIDRLTPVADRTIKDAAGGEHVAKVNKFGQDVTPPMPELGYSGSPAYWSYVKELNQYLPDFHPARGQFLMNQPKGASAGVAAPPPAGAPSLVAPSTGASQPLPEITPQAGGIPTVEPKGAYQTPQEIRSDMTKEPALKTYQEQSKYANNFKTIADTIETQGATVPGRSVPPQNANDLGLVESLIKLYDPQATIREFKWDKFENDQPRLEQLRNWTQTVLKNGTLTPEARQRLIGMGDEIVNSMEGTARDRLSLAKNAATNSAKLAGQDPNAWINQTLTADEQRILRGEPFRTPKSPAAASPASRAPGTVVLQSGRYAGYIYDPVTKKVYPPQ